MHVVFNESNPFDMRKDIIYDDVVKDVLEMSIQKKEDSKPLEFEGPYKEEVQEVP